MSHQLKIGNSQFFVLSSKVEWLGTLCTSLPDFYQVKALACNAVQCPCIKTFAGRNINAVLSTNFLCQINILFSQPTASEAPCYISCRLWSKWKSMSQHGIRYAHLRASLSPDAAILHCKLYTVRHKNTPKFIDHNLMADYQILIIFDTTIFDTTCHQIII